MRLVFFVVGCALFLGGAQAICEHEANGAFVPDPSSRSRFFWCWNGQAIGGECERGLEFDPFDRVCDTPRGTPNNPCQNRPDNTLFPDPSSRQRFLWCWQGQAIPAYCEAGKEFHPVDLVCDRVHQQNPPNPGPPSQRDPCQFRPDNTFLPDPNSRNRFIWCWAGESIPGFCPVDEVFHEQGEYCAPESAPTIRTPPVPTTTRPVGTTRPPVPTPRPPPNTTRAGPTTRAPPNTTRAGPPTTTRAGPPAPSRTTTRAGAPPMPTRQGRK